MKLCRLRPVSGSNTASAGTAATGGQPGKSSAKVLHRGPTNRLRATSSASYWDRIETLQDTGRGTVPAFTHSAGKTAGGYGQGFDGRAVRDDLGFHGLRDRGQPLSSHGEEARGRDRADRAPRCYGLRWPKRVVRERRDRHARADMLKNRIRLGIRCRRLLELRSRSLPPERRARCRRLKVLSGGYQRTFSI